MSEPNTTGNVDAILSLSQALARRMQAAGQRVWLNLHLSVPQLKVLFVLVASGPHSPSALAETLGVSPATVTGLCDGLVERGLALRESNRVDRRSVRVVATPEGEQLITDLWATHREQWTEIMQLLSEEEQKLVVEAFRTLLRAVERAPGWR